MLRFINSVALITKFDSGCYCTDPRPAATRLAATFLKNQDMPNTQWGTVRDEGRGTMDEGEQEQETLRHLAGHSL